MIRTLGSAAVVIALVSLVDVAEGLPPVWRAVFAPLLGAGAMFLIVFLWAWPASRDDR